MPPGPVRLGGDSKGADMAMRDIFENIATERIRQHQKWGRQNHPILQPGLTHAVPEEMARRYGIPTEEKARSVVEYLARNGGLTFADIFQEEWSEAVACRGDVVALRTELVQCAAVLVAMIESLDRNGR